MPVISFNGKWTTAAHFAKYTYYLCFLHCRIGCEIWRQGLSEIPLSNKRGQQELPSVSSTQDICYRGHSDDHQRLWLGNIRGNISQILWQKNLELILLSAIFLHKRLILSALVYVKARYKSQMQRKPSHPDNNRTITGNLTPPHDKNNIQTCATEACLHELAH